MSIIKIIAQREARPAGGGPAVGSSAAGKSASGTSPFLNQLPDGTSWLLYGELSLTFEKNPRYTPSGRR